MVIIREIDDDEELNKTRSCETHSSETRSSDTRSSDSLSMKEKGNAAYKSGKYSDAVEFYSQAIELCNSEQDTIVLHNNRAAAFIKLRQYENAIEDATQVLSKKPSDTKALFRRAQAYEALEKPEEAYDDAKKVLLIEPNNKEVQPLLSRLFVELQKKATERAALDNKMSRMFALAFDLNADREKRETAINNLLVLARENAGSALMHERRIENEIRNLLKVEKSREIRLTCVRIIGELCKKDAKRTKDIIASLGIPWFFDLLSSADEEYITAAQYCVQTTFNALSGLENNMDSRPDEKLCDENRTEIDTMLSCLVYSANSRSISGRTRDALLELIVRNVHYKAINWAINLVEIKGLQRLLEIACVIPEYKHESAMEITQSTRSLVSVCLTRIYENMYYDQAKKNFLDNIDEFLREKLTAPDLESKVEATVAITTILLGPVDVGNTIISRDGVIDMILVMASATDLLQQKVACECIIAAITKPDKAQMIISKGVDILKKLFESDNESIRVRALVGLCRLASSGGLDASIRPLADGASKQLATSCRNILVGSTDSDSRRWAAEGLSFLTLDAEIKEMLIEDKAALDALIDVGRTGNMAAVYGIVTALVNLCNAYEKEEILPEMIELAKFAKRHVPEQHELDDSDFVVKRILVLGRAGVTVALVALAKTESQSCKELIARVCNALCSQQELRGVVVQQGGAKMLLALALDCTEKGKFQAAQALARIGITIDPAIAFPGQRCLEVVRPLLGLLHPECKALENFEALMALCNLASVGEHVRKRILKEGGFSKIETYIYEEHEMLRRASVQCVTNLCFSEDVVKIFEGENDKLKFLFFLTGEEDEETSVAAMGALAILTSTSAKCCEKLLLIKNWQEIFKQMLARPNPDAQFRAVSAVYYVVSGSRENAEKIFRTDLMEVIMALSILGEGKSGSDNIQKMAEKCLACAEEMKLIKRPGAEGEDGD